MISPTNYSSEADVGVPDHPDGRGSLKFGRFETHEMLETIKKL
jgi:hypothetical protein